ncbi:hypothetical protein WJX75_008522 [Coccomyxa subellipsoidea]|uniref:Uncharacterized protein n=1 Tax=Coccomyxa subellipsoidea TaxID=248742 RepID=A0ABR2Z475_9CHLO
MMMNKESPKTAFDLLYTRFNTAPKMSNSILERIRMQVAYMGHENSLTYSKYFLAQHNKQAISRHTK